jgi:hypothetical protein
MAAEANGSRMWHRDRGGRNAVLDTVETIDSYLPTFSAQEEYEAARRRARNHALSAAIRRRNNALLSMADVEARVLIEGEHYAGVQQVPIHLIVGSLGREDDFDGEFNPVREHTRQRWTRIAAAHLNGEVLPPVDLLKVGDAYLVRDGNHRISVGRHFGLQYIDAVVTEYDTPCTLWSDRASGWVELWPRLSAQAFERLHEMRVRLFVRHDEDDECEDMTATVTWVGGHCA